MPSLAEYLQAIDAYRNGDVSQDCFEDWFRTASRSMFGESLEILKLCLAIEAAFSEVHYDGMSKSEFDRRLANAIRPFEVPKRPFGLVDTIAKVPRPFASPKDVNFGERREGSKRPVPGQAAETLSFALV